MKVKSMPSNDPKYLRNRVRPRFFDQVGDQTTNTSIGDVIMSSSDLPELWTELTKIGHMF